MTNGDQMKKVITRLIRTTTIARQSNPVAIKAFKIGGVTHGTAITTGLTKCRKVAR